MRAASKSRKAAKILLRPALCFCACNLLAAALAAQCSNPTQVQSQTISSGSPTFSDNNALSASSVVIGGSASVTFVAGNCIQLLPGFDAKAGTAGTTFHAWVETAPADVSASPSSGSGLSQPFTWTVSSPSGYSNLSDVFALFNTSVSGGSACYIHYNRASNLLYLADNTGANWLGGFAPGSSGSAGNPYCSIYGSGSSFSTSGTQLALTVSVTFQTSFAGSKNEYLIGSDNQGLNTTWQQMGTWTVPGSQQQYYLTTAVSPSGGGTIFPSCPGGCAYISGTVVQISASANTGYVFTGFSGNLAATASPQNFTVTGPASVTANFVAQAPTITSISPMSGAIGSNVTITGTGFGASGTVSFNGTQAPIVSWSATVIVAQVPVNATTGTVTVSTGGYQAGYYQQPFQVTPVTVTVSPATVTLGQGQTQQFTATVTGTTNQTVNWSVAPPGAWSVSPAGLFTAPGTIAALQVVTVTATSAAQTTGTATVNLTPPTPTITGLSLLQGPPQVGFVISGTNFGPAQGSATLTGLPGGDVQLQVISWNSTDPNVCGTGPTPCVTVQVPAAAPLGAGKVYVKTSGNTASNQLPFTVSGAFGCGN